MIISTDFQFRNKKVKDYSFTIGFFVVFSFFVIFAIRPNLSTAFTLQKELDQLKETDASYEDAILKIVDLQSVMQSYRDEFYLLDQAVPPSPQVNKVLDDVNKSASIAGLTLKRLNISKVNLKENQKKTDKQTYALSIEIDDDYDKLSNFMLNLSDQRRLKTVRNLMITRDAAQGSGSATLKIQMEVNGFYL